jgi:NAD(P)-dependent dehydrogenase (short-subunit alcohol dehydrogenase family)
MAIDDIMQLADHTFLITGGGSGLGAACVRRFTSLAARVVIADVNEEAGEAIVAEVGADAEFVTTDVTSAASVQAAIAAATRFGPLHGVVNCAGILGAARVVGREGPHDLELFSRVIQVNLIGTFNVLRLAAAAMVNNQADAEGERGVIVNTASIAAFEGQIGQAAYSASKGGVASMTLPVARELARYGIRVMAIAPGIFTTAMMDAAPAAVRQSIQSQTLFPTRFGKPDEFAALAQHIVENPMLNGEVIRLDGAIRLAPM